MLGWVVIERQQHVQVTGDLRNRLGPLGPVGIRKRLHSHGGVIFVLGVPDLHQRGLRVWLGRLGQGVEDVGDLVEPAPLFPGVGEHLAQRGPEPQRAVTDREDRGAHPAALTGAQQVSPGLAGLPVPVVEGNQFFGAIGTHPDHDQQAHLVLGQPDLEVNPVHPRRTRNPCPSTTAD